MKRNVFGKDEKKMLGKDGGGREGTPGRCDKNRTIGVLCG